MSAGRPNRRVNLLALTNQTITTSGVSSDLDTSDMQQIWVVVFVKGAATGTTPSLVASVEQQDGAGNFITTTQLTAITSGPNYVVATLTSTGALTRIRWTVTGTSQ